MEQSAFTVVFAIVNILITILVSVATVAFKLAKYQEKVDSLKEEKDKAIAKVDALRTDVDTLKAFKVNAQKFIDKSLYEAKSPLKLTELGKKIVSENGFETIFETVKDDLVAKLEALKPDTKYDAQEKARGLLDSLKDYPAFAPIEAAAFKNGTDFGQILRAGGILLRDYYFTKHPELKE